ncbi:hypothetical protein ACLOJK_019161 [Asimina triloba]
MMPNPAMTRLMQMMMRMMQEMCHDMQHEMRSSSDPTPPRRQGAQTDAQQINGHDDDDVWMMLNK